MLIGIGGVSRSGKTFLSKEILSCYRAKNVLILHQDDFVKEEADIPMVLDHIDWEVPESVDVEKWKIAIDTAIESYEIVILDGLFAFSYPEINQGYDKAILVEIPQEVFLTRKREDLRWGKEPEWYIQYIWDAYQIHGKPEDFDGYRVNGNSPLDEAGLKTYLEI